jgi:hypothetical protein
VVNEIGFHVQGAGWAEEYVCHWARPDAESAETRITEVEGEGREEGPRAIRARRIQIADAVARIVPCARTGPGVRSDSEEVHVQCAIGENFNGARPNDLAFSGTSGRAKRVTRSVRCNALLGVIY